MTTPCFGYSLRKASLIVCILEVIFALLTSSFYIMGLTAVQDSTMDLNQIKMIQTNFRIPFVNFQDANLKEIVNALTTIFSVGLITSLIAIGFGLFLYDGLRNAIPWKIKTWLFYEGTMIGLAIIYLLLMMTLGYSSIISVATDSASLGIHTYFCWIIYSYRNDIIENQVLDITPSIVQSKGKVEISFPM